MNWLRKHRHHPDQREPEPKPRYHTPLHSILSKMSDEAKAQNRVPPVIETDFQSARILQDALAESLGCYLRELRPSLEDIRKGLFFTICQYDDVKVVVRRVDPCKHEVDAEWREHFGPLADIWS